jgi:hypothetical protein
MKRLLSCLTVLALASSAEANQGSRDANGYIGTDSLMPALKLPATGPISLTLDASAPSSSGDIASTATLDASLGNEDAVFSFNPNVGGTASYAGSNLSTCEAHTNGLITCFGGSSPLFDNQPLPDLRFGGRYVVAPFWDDLTVVAGQSSIKFEVRNGVSFTVQWNNFSLYSNAAARLTFRVTFYYGASSGAVAFHYLSMMGTGADGRSATIGIQAPNTQFERSNQYAYNKTGAVVVGTATSGLATQAILFDFDGDGDRLPRALEVIATSADNDVDSDGGSLDDGAEIAAGKDPTSNADDGATTDTDGDTLTNLDEAFYGTMPAVVDTDSDKDATTPINSDAARSDADEIYGVGGYFTDPKRADTDGDGYNDGREIFLGTDPVNRTDFPKTVVSDGTGGRWRHPHAVLDTSDNVHIVMVSENGALFYTMLDSQGGTLIPATRYKALSSLDIRSARIGVTGGKAYIVFEAINNGSTSVQGVVRINPTLAPRDGTPILFAQVLEAESIHALSGFTRHCDASIGAGGIVISCERHPQVDSPDDNASARGIEVASFGLDGSLRYDVTVASFSNSEQGVGDSRGIHKVSAPQVAMDSAGVAHVVYMMKVGPDDGFNAASTYYYAQLSTAGSVTGPYYLAPGHAERFAIALHGSSLMIADTNGDDNAGQGLRTGEFDTASLNLKPHSGDPLGITKQVTMANPMKTVFVNDIFRAAGLVRRADGQALIAFQQARRTHQVCIVAASNQGVLQGTPECGLLNDFGTRQRYLDPLLFSNGQPGMAYRSLQTPHGCCGGYQGTGRVSFAKFPASSVVFATSVNTAPTFTSAAAEQTGRVGVAFSYTATATDVESPTNLTFSLASGPIGVAVSATGAITWTPTAAQRGPADLVIEVCDNGNPSPVLCTKQTLPVTVVDPHAPMIVSIPALEANVDRAYSYQVVADDPDDDVTTYTLVSPPIGDMALSPTGMLTWTPTEADLGTVSIVVQVTDAAGLTATQSFSVNVDYTAYQPKPITDNGCCDARTRAPTAPALALWLVCAVLVLRRRRLAR